MDLSEDWLFNIAFEDSDGFILFLERHAADDVDTIIVVKESGIQVGFHVEGLEFSYEGALEIIQIKLDLFDFLKT
jgi:hypothetical protein